MEKQKKFFLIILVVATIFSGISIPDMQAGASGISANLLQLDNAWTPGEITKAGEVHFYSVTIPTSGWLMVDYQGWSIADSYYHVLNEDMTREYSKINVYTSSAINPLTSSQTLALEAGTYMIRIYGSGNHIGEYKVKASFKSANNNEKLDNNDFSTAEKLVLDLPVNGFLSMDDRVDFFQLNLSAKSSIRLIYTAYIADSFIQIYNSDYIEITKKNIYTASENSPLVYEYAETLNPGTYYIKIYPYGNKCGRYSIQYKEKVAAGSMSVKGKSSVVAGKKVKLSVQFNPSNTSDKKVKWISGDTNIATVDENTGMVTTYRAGIVKITAKAQDGSGLFRIFTLVVKPKKMSVPKLSCLQKKQLHISFNGQLGVRGYQIQYATNNKFKGAKTKKTSSTSITLKNLKKNKQYYIRVRAYVQTGGEIYPGNWSKVKKIKVR